MTLADTPQPEILTIAPNRPHLEIFAPQNSYDPDTGELTDIQIVPTLVLAGATGLPDVDPTHFTEAVVQRFNAVTYHIGKMRRLAELNLDNLSDTLSLYLQVHPLEEVLDRNAACRRLGTYINAENFDKLTFENLRGLLSCVVKTDEALHTIGALSTPEARKDFTRLYEQYIEDRNRYTHGILFFLYPQMTPVLRVKTEAGEDRYLHYNKALFCHNLQIFGYLNTVLAGIKKVLLT